VRITGNIPKLGRQIVLNANELMFDEVHLDGGMKAAVTLDDNLGRAALNFSAAFVPGRHALSIAYQGPITKATVGFFAMDYDTSTGKRRTLATNFEPRRRGSCFLLGRARAESDFQRDCGCARRPDGNFKHAGGDDHAHPRWPQARTVRPDAQDVNLSSLGDR
jgi:hypothetical protein